MCVRWGSAFSDFFLVNNGVRQGGILSPLLFNVYINELSESLSKLPVGCCCGNTVVNHLMYADDIVLFAPSAKGLQRIINVCDNDIILNSSKSQVMFFDTMKYGHMKNIMLGQKTLNVTKSYTSLSSSFPFVRGEVLPATFSPPHLIVFSTLLCLLSSSSSLPPRLPSSHLS